MTYEHWLDIVKKYYLETLENVPEEFITQEMCDAAVFHYCLNLKHVPEKFKTQENCVSAVEKNGLTLEYVPKKLKTKEICTKALESLNKWARDDLEKISTIDDKWYPTGIFGLKDLEELNTFFSYIPFELRDSEMYLSFFELCHNIGYAQGHIQGYTRF